MSTRRTIVRWTPSSSARVLSKSCRLPQPEARPDEPLVLSLWILLIPSPGKDSTIPLQTLRHNLINPDLLHPLLDPSSHQPSTSTTDSIPVPVTARSPAPSGFLPGHQEPHPPTLPKLSQPLRHLTRQLPLEEDIADGIESYLRSQYIPDNFNIAVGCTSQVPYAFTLSFSSTWTDDRRTKEEPDRPRHHLASRTALPRHLLSDRLPGRPLALHEPAGLSPFVINTDEKTEYKTASRIFPSGVI